MLKIIQSQLKTELELKPGPTQFPQVCTNNTDSNLSKLCQYVTFTGEKTKESFNMYQEDITDLKWKTEQQVWHGDDNK